MVLPNRAKMERLLVIREETVCVLKKPLNINGFFNTTEKSDKGFALLWV